VAHIGRRIARNCQILAIAVLALATLFTSGCDECDQGQWACRDGATFQCVDDGDGPFNGWHWVPQAGCTVACHEAGGQTRCVDSREPVPECTSDADAVLCFEGVPSGCWDGYPVKGRSCETGLACEVMGGEALCQ